MEWHIFKMGAGNDATATGGGGTTQNLFETFTGDTGSTTASAANDTFNIVGGTNISTALVGDTLTITMTGAMVLLTRICLKHLVLTMVAHLQQ